MHVLIALLTLWQRGIFRMGSPHVIRATMADAVIQITSGSVLWGRTTQTENKRDDRFTTTPSRRSARKAIRYSATIFTRRHQEVETAALAQEPRIQPIEEGMASHLDRPTGQIRDEEVAMSNRNMIDAAETFALKKEVDCIFRKYRIEELRFYQSIGLPVDERLLEDMESAQMRQAWSAGPSV